MKKKMPGGQVYIENSVTMWLVIFLSLIYEICRKWVDCVNKMNLHQSFFFLFFLRVYFTYIYFQLKKKKNNSKGSSFDYHELSPFENKTKCDLFMPETKYDRSHLFSNYFVICRRCCCCWFHFSNIRLPIDLDLKWHQT